jgi:hypothetical protein
MDPIMAGDQAVTILKILFAAGFGGGLMSALVSLVVEADWSARVKETIVFISCLMVSFLGVLVSGVNVSDLVVVIPAVILGCKGAYIVFWKPTGIASRLEDIFSTNGRI